MVSVSVAAAFVSATTTLVNGSIGVLSAVDEVCVPEIVGATAATVLVTTVASSVAGVPKALLVSLSVKVVGVMVFGALAGREHRSVELGRDRRRRCSVQGVEAARPAGHAGPGKRSVRPGVR